MTLSNFQKWRLYMDNVVSPQSYIDFGFYYLISAVLQRRVWCPPDHARIYPNMFIILVGPPATGKGVVIKPVTEILRHYKLENPALAKTPDGVELTPEQREVRAAIMEANYSLATSGSRNAAGQVKEKDEPLLIPIAADATTYEALIRSLAEAVRRKDYSVYDEKLQKNITKIYTHSSLCFCLEEISSLFKKNREDVVKLLLNAYDCGDYSYDTKTQGKDSVKKCCLNFFGGTTPGFIQSVFDENILDDGFSSRTHFIMETSNRKRNFFIPELREEQKGYKQEIIDHVGKVAHLYGPVTVSQEDREWLQEWIQREHIGRSNTSSKLEGYYGRINLHLMKLAMCIHFGESLDMTIPRSAFEKAMEVSREIEKKMHYALEFNGSNPLFKAAKKAVSFLRNNGARTKNEMLVELAPDLPNLNGAIDEVIEYLIQTAQVEMEERPNKAGVKKFHYFVPSSKEKAP
jgi:adenylate kinase family enzyme